MFEPDRHQLERTAAGMPAAGRAVMHGFPIGHSCVEADVLLFIMAGCRSRGGGEGAESATPRPTTPPVLCLPSLLLGAPREFLL